MNFLGAFLGPVGALLGPPASPTRVEPTKTRTRATAPSCARCRNNTDSVASHELVEATTDPAVGLATVFGPPPAWHDQTDNGEIGDLCNAQQGSIPGFTVQQEWSNAAHACVDH